MIAEDTGQALELAARANEVVARVIGWCLADGRPQAAVGVAEMGRGLVLASVALSGQAAEILQSADQPEAAAAWRAGDETGRAAALAALREITAGSALLTTPIEEEISVSMISTWLDAVVYLIPPAGPGAAGPDLAELGTASQSGHALLVRPGAGGVEVVPLPELADLGPQSPLGRYLAALDGAMHARHREAAEEGFRGGPAGQTWADALDEVGRWTYSQILSPVLTHVREWSLGRRPHLALVPIGELAAIPYAAAWTGGPAEDDRRYAIEDVVLSHAASARLLGEVSRRPRQPLGERVVLVTAPHGDLPMSRRATRLLASRQYPRAEVYGVKSERNGAATSEVLLKALPARHRQGASLLQLSTHGMNPAEPGLEVADGVLPLARILEQARDRARDAPGGLVITNACVTDITRTHYDESLTMATAFLAAGATAVIGTRWPVDDDMMAMLSLRLHYHLQLGCHPAEALRRAQLDLIRPTEALRAGLDPALAAVSDARLSHPASWAGHVHHGI
jgi:CHAT domain-containing protein